MLVEWRIRRGPFVAALWLACAAVLLLALAPLVAQSPRPAMLSSGRGSLSVKLTDSRSAPLAGATLILRNQATGAERHTGTGRKGAYRFRNLRPGKYTLIAQAGNKLGRGAWRGIEIRAGAETRLAETVRMKVLAADGNGIQAGKDEMPAAASSSKSRGEAAKAGPVAQAVQQSSPLAPAVSTDLTGTELESLPVSGRRWQEFVLDTPTASTEGGGEGQPTMRGSATETVDMTVDGVSTRLAFGETGARRPSASGNGGNGPIHIGQAWGGRAPFSEAAIRQVRTLAGNVDASSETGASGHVEVTTESGSNQLHGEASIFDRQNTWGARNPFAQWVKETSAATNSTTPVFTPFPYTPPDHEMTLELGAGGRIRRDRLFWFGSLTSRHRNDPAVSMVRHPDEFFAQPSNDEMQVLSARLGLSSVNPVAEGLGAYSKMLETLAGLLGPAPRRSGEWAGFGRVDWKATERQTFTVEGSGASWDAPGGGIRGVSENYGNHSIGSSGAARQWAMARWQTFITPNLLAVTQGSIGREAKNARPGAPSDFESTLEQSAWGQLPQIVV